MKNFILVITLLFCSSLNAEWIFYAETDLNERIKLKSWYDNKRIEVKEENVFVWERRKSLNPKIKFSQEYYLKLNCSEWSMKKLKFVHFSDDNWTNINDKSEIPSSKEFISSRSSIQKLAEIVCKK